VIAAAVLLGERPQPLQAVGAALILAGVVMTVGQPGETAAG
jgi:drug/metabolite transporter (DMT)-like permease